ncbi:KH domain-containing protein 3 [Folsomia candida]|uniref:KH domain-containing protein 3 n=1 Tax=Folsomia candida TaxID=158441 RepID=A0A226D778_FOLCA|nr:KH domain-containing protein 3 [Folsomia candida]
MRYPPMSRQLTPKTNMHVSFLKAPPPVKQAPLFLIVLLLSRGLSHAKPFSLDRLLNEDTNCDVQVLHDGLANLEFSASYIYPTTTVLLPAYQDIPEFRTQRATFALDVLQVRIGGCRISLIFNRHWNVAHYIDTGIVQDSPVEPENTCNLIVEYHTGSSNVKVYTNIIALTSFYKIVLCTYVFFELRYDCTSEVRWVKVFENPTRPSPTFLSTKKTQPNPTVCSSTQPNPTLAFVCQTRPNPTKPEQKMTQPNPTQPDPTQLRLISPQYSTKEGNSKCEFEMFIYLQQ